jgi:hypothetical protein
MKKKKRSKAIVGYAGFENNKILLCYGLLTDCEYYEIYANKEGALTLYEDVRKVKIIEV